MRAIQSQYGDISNTLSKAGLSLLGETGTRVVFRSNVTPDITVDISGLLKSKAQAGPGGVLIPGEAELQSGNVPVSSADKRLLKLIRPEISVNALGNAVSYAPYGRPSRTTAIIIVSTMIAAALIGAKIAWVTCKKI